jgi:hypothetical protein
MTGAEEALGSSGQASELGTGQSTGFAWARQPRGDCSLHRNAGKQTGVMKAETVRPWSYNTSQEFRYASELGVEVWRDVRRRSERQKRVRTRTRGEGRAMTQVIKCTRKERLW